MYSPSQGQEVEHCKHPASSSTPTPQPPITIPSSSPLLPLQVTTILAFIITLSLLYFRVLVHLYVSGC